MVTMKLIFSFLCLFNLLVHAEIVSPSRNFNVTLPEPNTPYVAGQMLPISYTLPDDDKLSTVLLLSISFAAQDPTSNFTQVAITSNADISQGFSFKRMRNTDVYYEHQLSYSIPNNTDPGNYHVIFSDAVSGTNVSVPIIVRPYAPPSTTTSVNKANPSGSIFKPKSDAVKTCRLSSMFIIFMFIALLY
ncbi:hypothetical protein CU098_013925 [Rhizopus stolonifer]|uniref:Uncharacterized protein n=1 Tax=Rhizopus stolonifer TaxID=4846 RepID=A0A367KYR3_RHIST|nr:hypothetical protein CU098_013925 [Rhizopus stolonifer]